MYRWAPGFTDANRYQTGNITWTRTISPTMLNELRFATNRCGHLRRGTDHYNVALGSGISHSHPDDPKGTAPPLVTVDGNFNLGPSPQGPTKIHDTTFQYQDTLSWTKGRARYEVWSRPALGGE